MPARNYSNTAQPTSLTSGVNNSAATLPVASTAGYPNPPFLVALERGDANEEVVLVQGKVSNAFTNCLRGYDGTTAASHLAGKPVEHTTAAIDYSETSEHINNTALDHHTQYLTPARHATIDHNLPTFTAPPAPPVGSFWPFWGTTNPDPTKFLLLFGQPVSRSTYSILFSQIGISAGPGDGVNTFNVPDLRGRIPMGLDNIGGSAAGITPGVTTLGARSGETNHILTLSELAPHSHGGGTGSGGTHSHASGASSTAGVHTHAMSGAGDHTHTTGSISHAHGGGTNLNGNPQHAHAIGGPPYNYYFVIQQSGSGNSVAVSSGPYQATNVLATEPSTIPHEHTIGTDTHTHSHTVTSAPQHSHSLSSDGSHSHSFTTDAAGGHNHTISSDGSGVGHNNLQPYIACAYLMRAA